MRNLASTNSFLLNSTPPGGKISFLKRHVFSGHCKALAPEYAKAAQRLAQNNPPYYLAKVDATESKSIGERFAIKGFPTLFFFK